MKKRIVLERTFKASAAEVWALWTTRQGFESWWGPEGFEVTVQRLDLRPGGKLEYLMTAVAPEVVAFMKREHQRVSHPASATFLEIEPERRLSYVNHIDFVPGVGAYDVDTVVELHPVPAGIRMVLTMDAMHDDLWTQRATMGWESQLGKLTRRFETQL
jgi:uncharacterized protein YndB with AHSA1/START domain